MASYKDPGILRPAYPFMDVLSKIHPCEMCPDCEVIRTNRSKHCAICNRCVERFDHHCPWINNCVGVHNHNSFLVFISTLLIVLILIIISSIVMLSNECFPREQGAAQECPLIEICIGCKILWLRYLLLLVTLCISLFFGGPATILFYVHSKNYFSGKTTNERFARQARTASLISESENFGSVSSFSNLDE